MPLICTGKSEATDLKNKKECFQVLLCLSLQEWNMPNPAVLVVVVPDDCEELTGTHSIDLQDRNRRFVSLSF